MGEQTDGEIEFIAPQLALKIILDFKGRDSHTRSLAQDGIHKGREPMRIQHSRSRDLELPLVTGGIKARGLKARSDDLQCRPQLFVNRDCPPGRFQAM